jgi:hypothetical protein
MKHGCYDIFVPFFAYGAGAVAWWQKSNLVDIFENSCYYCSALSDPFGNLKYAPKNSGTRTFYGIKKIERIFLRVPPI